MNESYIAGLFDGEGYVGVVRHPTFERTYTIRATITNTSPEVLYMLAERYEGTAVHVKEIGGPGCYCYTWIANGPKAISFLETIKGLVIIKRDQVEVALRFPITPRGHRTNDADVARREEIRDTLSRLKKIRQFVAPKKIRKELMEREDVKRAVEMYRAGSTCAEVAAELGAEINTVASWIRKLGHMRSRSDAIRRGQQRRFADIYKAPEVLRAVELYKSGLSVAEVAKAIGRKHGAVYMWLRKLGLTRSLSDAQKLRHKQQAP